MNVCVRAIDEAGTLSTVGGRALLTEVAIQIRPIRWVATKEAHASNTQKIIAEYFMTQRIKPTGEGYMKKLPAAHAVMVAAMKCKQTVDPANAEALHKSILKFYEAYEGKKPTFAHSH